MATDRRIRFFGRVIGLAILLVVFIPTAWLLIRGLALRAGWHFSPPVAAAVAGAIAGLCYGMARRVLGSPASAAAPVNRPEVKLATPESHGYVCIYREPSYADQSRAYSVVLDDIVIGELAPGRLNETFAVPAGEHRVSVKIDWCGSNTLSINVMGKTTEMLKVSSNAKGVRVLLGLWYALFSPQSYLRLDLYQPQRGQ